MVWGAKGFRGQLQGVLTFGREEDTEVKDVGSVGF